MTNSSCRLTPEESAAVVDAYGFDYGIDGGWRSIPRGPIRRALADALSEDLDRMEDKRPGACEFDQFWEGIWRKLQCGR